MEEHLLERLARERGITVEEMREIISARIEKGWNDPDQEKREKGAVEENSVCGGNTHAG